MEIKRTDARDIDQNSLDIILTKFGIDRSSLHAVGTEAQVYALESDRLLKVYSNPEELNKMLVLRDFYAMVDASGASFQIPEILGVKREGEVLGVIEKKLSGEPLAEAMAKYGDEEQKVAIGAYFDTAWAMGELGLVSLPDRFLLFDSKGESSVQDQDWNGYLRKLINQKIEKLEKPLGKLVDDFPEKREQFAKLFAGSFGGKISVIHGDFFPGNVLVESPSSVTGVIDFGMFTMFGDRMFDMATSWLFHTMYSDNDTAARSELLPYVLERCPQGTQNMLYRYGLLYALLSCDMWVGEEELEKNGHFLWSRDILNNSDYWERAK
jgi:hypothetical protein